MGTGSKIALGCGCLVLAGLVAAVGLRAAGVLGQGQGEGRLRLRRDGEEGDAVTDEIERWEREANANPYSLRRTA